MSSTRPSLISKEGADENFHMMLSMLYFMEPFRVKRNEPPDLSLPVVKSFIL